MRRHFLSLGTALAATFLCAAQAAEPATSTPAVTPDMIQTGSDIPAHVSMPIDQRDYIKRDVMIPMRDGIKLHTVIVIPKGARTPRSC